MGVGVQAWNFNYGGGENAITGQYKIFSYGMNICRSGGHNYYIYIQLWGSQKNQLWGQGVAPPNKLWGVQVGTSFKIQSWGGGCA